MKHPNFLENIGGAACLPFALLLIGIIVLPFALIGLAGWIIGGTVERSWKWSNEVDNKPPTQKHTP